MLPMGLRFCNAFKKRLSEKFIEKAMIVPLSVCHVNTPYACVVTLCICNLADIRFGLVIHDPSTSRVSEFTPFSESA